MRFDKTHDTLTILIAATLPLWPVSASAHAADAPRTSRLETTVAASVAPGDDFYAYANGAWLAATPLPAGKEKWGTRDELDALARRRIAALLDAAGAAPAGSPARKVADFRA